MSDPLIGQCLCGNVQFQVKQRPEYVNDGNCSLCTKLGALWAYYPSDEIDISGKTRSYVRTDLTEPALTVHHCPTCGATTHWVPLEDGPHRRMGINARLFADGVIGDVEVRYPDCKSWAV